MEFHLTVQMDNAAFGDMPERELYLILNNVADRVRLGEDTHGQIFDSNGASVGRWTITNPA